MDSKMTLQQKRDVTLRLLSLLKGETAAMDTAQLQQAMRDAMTSIQNANANGSKPSSSSSMVNTNLSSSSSSKPASSTPAPSNTTSSVTTTVTTVSGPPLVQAVSPSNMFSVGGAISNAFGSVSSAFNNFFKGF